MNKKVNLDTIFFENNDLSKLDAEKIVAKSLSGAEDGELYMQSSENENFSFDDGKLKIANSNKNIGFGLRSLSGEVVGYAHASEISKKALGKKEIIFADSFFNIFTSGSGATPHHHIGTQDNNFGLYLNKYSLVYYLEIGDQTGEDPGILKLYKPDEEILPTNGMVVIINSEKYHSVSYSGTKDRVMVGVNFYGLW